MNGKIPFKAIKSWVSVPVLSKHTVVTIPPSTTLSGWIQLIFLSYNRCIDTNTPIENAAAIYGGQLIVIKSKKLKNISPIGDTYPI